MTLFWSIPAALLMLVIIGAWWVDRDARKRGYKLHINHQGMRRQVTVERLNRPED